MVQQVVRVAVAVSAHHHQGNEGGQENGGQHPDRHDHHRLHGDSGFHGGCRRRLVSRGRESNQDRLIVRARLWALICWGGRIMAGFSLIGRHRTKRKYHYRHTWGCFCKKISILLKRRAPLSQWRRIQSAVFCSFPNVAHLQRTHKNSLSEYTRSWSVLALCLRFIRQNESWVFATGRPCAKLGQPQPTTNIKSILSS